MTRLSSFRTAVAALRALRDGSGNGPAYMRSLRQCQRAWGLLHTGRDGLTDAMTPEARRTWSAVLSRIQKVAEA